MDYGAWGSESASAASQSDIDENGVTTKPQTGLIRPKTSVHAVNFPHPYPTSDGMVYVTLQYQWNYHPTLNGTRPAGRCTLEGVTATSFAFANSGIGNASLDWVRWKAEWVPAIAV